MLVAQECCHHLSFTADMYCSLVSFLLQPGCVNTTEVDIKKACRMNRHSKMSRVSALRTFYTLFFIDDQLAERNIQSEWLHQHATTFKKGYKFGNGRCIPWDLNVFQTGLALKGKKKLLCLRPTSSP